VPHRLIKSGSQDVLTESLSQGTIRNLVDNFGFSLDSGQHVLAEIETKVIAKEISPMPGTPFISVGGPGSVGFGDPIPSLVPFTVPAGIAAPDWSGLVRTAIDAWMGGQPTQLQEGPLALPPASPTPGLFPPGGLQNPLPPTIFPTAVRTGGRAAFITMPNGLPGCPSGYHPEKSGKPYCVRNRRMNPLNPRALSRATRRVGGFARAVKRARTLKKICRTL